MPPNTTALCFLYSSIAHSFLLATCITIYCIPDFSPCDCACVSLTCILQQSLCREGCVADQGPPNLHHTTRRLARQMAKTPRLQSRRAQLDVRWQWWLARTQNSTASTCLIVLDMTMEMPPVSGTSAELANGGVQICMRFKFTTPPSKISCPCLPINFLHTSVSSPPALLTPSSELSSTSCVPCPTSCRPNGLPLNASATRSCQPASQHHLHEHW